MENFNLKDELMVSCLCVVNCSEEELKKSVRNFFQQNHSNKELILVFDSNKINFKDISFPSSIEEVIFIPIDEYGRYSVAKLNEIALCSASGEYFCIWNPSDWHHPRRISEQLDGILFSHKECSVLFHHLVNFPKKRESYAAPRRPLEKSLLCDSKFFRSQLNFNNDLPEDSRLFNELMLRNCIFPVSEPTLYIENGLRIEDYGEFLPDIILKHSQKMDREICSDISIVVSNLPDLEEVELIFEKKLNKEIRSISALRQNIRALSRSV